MRVDPGLFARIYAGLGEKDQAFEWLERAYSDRPSLAAFAKGGPLVGSFAFRLAVQRVPAQDGLAGMKQGGDRTGRYAPERFLQTEELYHTAA